MSEKLIPAHPPEIVNPRRYLDELCLYWRNNYISVEKFAEDHDLTVEEGSRLIDLARDVYIRRLVEIEPI